ncbi:hypothetical protein CMASS_05930 [Corynebacterium massiliense DSM 45435]|uniref:LemA family protein n=2 Tax=Corynebacterium massiliense TaxID=441501 RepID=A0ABY7UAY3_9CORY|nr:hypothetical protein CMASS_05930 [Corynebacterium massiliense DSM 45435]
MMTWVAVVAAVAVTCLALWAYFTAQRLNSLHIRTDAARASLQAVLDRRAAVVAALLPGDPNAQRVASAAEATALDPADFSARAERESAVTEVTRCHLEPPPAQLVDAEVRLQLAQRFYNEAVADTRALRLRPLVRMFRLGGTARLPQFFDYTVIPPRPGGLAGGTGATAD